MRVLHIDTGLEMRGGQRQAMLLINGLEARGIAPLLLANRDGSLYAAAQAKDWPVNHASAASTLLLSRQVDIVHVHDARAHTLATLASHRPFVVSRRVAFPVNRSFVSRWKYSRASEFLAVSKAVARELEMASIPSERIVVVHDGVPIDDFAWRWCPEAPVVVPASCDPAKGQDLVDEVSKLTAVPIITSRNLEQDLHKARAFLYVTRFEGLGSAALLAMSMGVPVIASRVGGLAEVFEDGISGIYVENDPKQIAVAVERLSHNGEFAARLGSAGRKRARDLFSKEQMVAKTLAAYRRVLERSAL